MPSISKTLIDEAALGTTPEVDPIEYLRESILEGRDWSAALVETMALWTVPEETVGDRHYVYFIGGEAFDWLLLAERLCEAAGDLIPESEKEDLLFSERWPECFDGAQFKDLLGAQKHRGYLNYFYGVTVEEVLHLAVEREVQKRHLSNGNQYQQDFSEEAFSRIYREPKNVLLEEFSLEMGYSCQDSMTLNQCKEFTYWLFKYRLKMSDKAKIASDTRKGLKHLHEMTAATGGSPSPIH